MIVVVFDPLAVIMLLASQMTFAWSRGAKPQVEDTTGPELVDGLRNRFRRKEDSASNIDNLEPVFDREEIPDLTDYTEGAVSTKDPEPEEELPVVAKKPRWSGFGFPMSGIFGSKSEVKSEPVEPVESVTNPLAMDERPGDYVEQPVIEVPRPVNPEAAPGRNRGVMHTHLAIEADNAPKLGRPASTGFGNEFPINPEKGDVYLRIDFLPNRLFKFNGKKWIEVDKTQTDVYAYEDEYIKHLVDEIDAGRYDPDILTEVEREQIRQFLEKNG
jgi:hypothetical protein